VLLLLLVVVLVVQQVLQLLRSTWMRVLHEHAQRRGPGCACCSWGLRRHRCCRCRCCRCRCCCRCCTGCRQFRHLRQRLPQHGLAPQLLNGGGVAGRSQAPQLPHPIARTPCLLLLLLLLLLQRVLLWDSRDLLLLLLVLVVLLLLLVRRALL
jgi:hypothetical protein